MFRLKELFNELPKKVQEAINISINTEGILSRETLVRMYCENTLEYNPYRSDGLVLADNSCEFTPDCVFRMYPNYEQY